MYPSAKALVVDDNMINQKVIQGFLKEYQIHVTRASSGYEALDYMKSGENFDIIFMDHMMRSWMGWRRRRKFEIWMCRMRNMCRLWR